MPTEAHAGWWSSKAKSVKSSFSKAVKSVSTTVKSVTKSVTKKVTTTVKKVTTKVHTSVASRRSSSRSSTSSSSSSSSSGSSSSSSSGSKLISATKATYNAVISVKTNVANKVYTSGVDWLSASKTERDKLVKPESLGSIMPLILSDPSLSSLKTDYIQTVGTLLTVAGWLMGADEYIKPEITPIQTPEDKTVISNPIIPEVIKDTGNIFNTVGGSSSGGSSGGSGGTGLTFDDNIAPEISYNVTGTMGENGWFISNVTITILATDDKELSVVQYSMDGGKTQKDYDYKKNTQLKFSQSGQYNFSTIAVDTSGNYRIGALNTKNMKQIGNPSKELISNNLDSLNKFLEKNHIKVPEDLKK
ncbi:hypothetical protein GQ473_00870 [archaeon]|nr:hypothetical protein [archaeon]